MRATVTTTTSSQWGTRSSSSRPPSTRAPADSWGTAHPAVVQTDEGSCNLGVAAWRALLDMTAPMDPITEPESGLTNSQRENIMATCQNMPPLQIAHLLGSFLRTIAVVCHEVADCLEESIDAGVEQGGESSLMHRYLKKSEDKDKKAEESLHRPVETTGGADVPLFGSAVELQLSTIVSALEIMSRHTAARRAKALRQHLHLLYLGNEGRHQGLPEEAGWVDSAMVTFLEDEGESSEADFGEEPLVGQDKEFVDYWWRVLHRHLPRRDDDTGAAGELWKDFLKPTTSSSGAAQGDGQRFSRPLRTTQLDVEDLGVSQEEIALQRLLDRAEPEVGKRETEGEATMQMVVDTVPGIDTWTEQQVKAEQGVAACYKAWEMEVVEDAMTRPQKRARCERDVQVVMRGGTQGVEAASSPVFTQSSTWVVKPGQNLVLQLHLQMRDDGTAGEAQAMGSADKGTTDELLQDDRLPDKGGEGGGGE